MADTAQLTEQLTEGVKALREKILPLPQRRALEAWLKIDPPSTVGGQQPMDCTDWLQRHSPKLGLVKGDGLCQYSEFSKAAFSIDKHAK